MSKVAVNVSKRAIIEQAGAWLFVDQSTSALLCPFCEGGDRLDRSFVITRRANGLVYCCHRASCGAKGATTTGRMPAPRDLPKFVPNYLPEELEVLSPAQATSLKARYRLETLTDVYRSGARVAIGVRGPAGELRGYETRAFPGQGGPKSLHYKLTRAAWQAWLPGVSGAVAIVEDNWSARRIQQATGGSLRAVALLGTHMSLDRASEIAAGKPYTVFLALDKDATSKAHKMRKEFSLLWGDTRIIPLKRDIKDVETDDEVAGLFGL